LSSRRKPVGHKKYEDFNAFAAFETKWRAKAACKESDNSIFFAPSKSLEAKKALSICAKCPVQSECFYSAMIYQYHGIWGGFTQEARSAILTKVMHNDLSDFTPEKAKQIHSDLVDIYKPKTKAKSISVRPR
jgi:hypothetical protein